MKNYSIRPFGCCPRHYCYGEPDAKGFVRGDWFSLDGNRVDCAAFHVSQLDVEPNSTGYWDAVCVWLNRRFPFTKNCAVGACGSRPECNLCVRTHLDLNIDPMCVDHG